MNDAAALERAPLSRWEYPAVFAAAFGLLIVFLVDDRWMDQYLFLRWGQRWSEGQVPYRDFFMYLWPGHAGTIALWFAAAGTDMASVRVLQALAGAGGALCAFGCARALGLGRLRWTAPAGALALFVAGYEGLIHPVFSVPCCLGALWAALHAECADRAGGAFGWRWWALSGAGAAAAGLYTQNVGVWMGLALVGTAASGMPGRRARSALSVCAGAAAVLLPLVIWLAAQGLAAPFAEQTFMWIADRYRRFHAGVRWGQGLPAFDLLRGRPPAQVLLIVPYVLLMDCAVFLFPLLIVYSAVRWFRGRKKDRTESPLRRVIVPAAAALYLVSWPHSGAHHIARTAVPALLLAAYELERLLSPATKRWAPFALAAALLLVVPLQRLDGFVTLATPRGTVRLPAGAAENLQRLGARLPEGSTVLCLPVNVTGAYLWNYRNPTAFEGLQPVFNTPAQFERAAAELEAAGLPPVAGLGLELDPARERARLEGTFGPSAYLDECAGNALYRLLAGRYEAAYREGGVLVLRAAREAPAAGE